MHQYIEPFIEVCTLVFKKMAQCDLTAGRAYFIAREDFQNWDISGLISLSGETRGLVAISMKTETAIRITENITGKKHTYLDSDVIDAIGEIVNIVAGNVKQKLQDMFKLALSLPYVIKGKAHMIALPRERRRLLCIPFTAFEDQIICLSIAIDS
ncbi:MAG: chemotaxis protein CheX [Spirochaetaceae bacterium]|jgi:chemotaxis protein CheX|nr:chemotaxis protein CheX [Spirochaetaceae bacterium]